MPQNTNRIHREMTIGCAMLQRKFLTEIVGPRWRLFGCTACQGPTGAEVTQLDQCSPNVLVVAPHQVQALLCVSTHDPNQNFVDARWNQNSSWWCVVFLIGNFRRWRDEGYWLSLSQLHQQPMGRPYHGSRVASTEPARIGILYSNVIWYDDWFVVQLCPFRCERFVNWRQNDPRPKQDIPSHSFISPFTFTG